MKIVTPQTMADIEAQAYRNGASESDFMEEAGSGVALVVHDYVEKNDIDRIAVLLCGKGNNAGDAYVAGINLLHLDYEVIAIQVTPIENCAPLCKQNFERFMHEGGKNAESLREFPPNGIIIDGLFGTGFRGAVEEPYLSLIQSANRSRLPIISVDIPSGLNGETGQVSGAAIIATETAFLGLPKLGFFLEDGWNFVGKLRYVDFGLGAEYIESAPADYVMLTPDLIKPLLPPIKRNRHKYQTGYVVGLAGSAELPGAALLSSTAALRGGAGMVRLLYPKGMENELVASPYELIRVPYEFDHPMDVSNLMNKAGSTFVGPGIGRSNEMRQLLETVLPRLEKPSVIDADALTMLAEKWIKIPLQSVLTPHMGEMARLLEIDFTPTRSIKFLQTCKHYADAKGITLVLKGGPTFIFSADLPVLVNPSGDPGMATAGSGDVLTGLLAALISQGMHPRDAAPAGVYIHGLAGEHAAAEMTSRGLIASDIIFHLPEAFQFYLL